MQLATERSAGYELIDSRARLQVAVRSFEAHAILVWFLLPLFVLAEFLVPQLQPTPERSYPSVSLVVVALVVAHHIAAESRAWGALKSLQTRPELVVLQQKGVLRRRRWLLLLGIVEDLDMYTDLVFPCFAYICDEAIHGKWLRSWEAIPMVGKTAAKFLERWRFWGVSGLLFAIAWVGAVAAFLRLSCGAEAKGLEQQNFEETDSDDDAHGSTPHARRMSGEQYFALARFAETALMPSVSLMCEEMGSQRQWVFDAKSATGGASGAYKARREVLSGRRTLDSLQMFELDNQFERERVDVARRVFYALLLVGRTLVGNAMQMWLQASFLALSFGYLGEEASYKTIIGIALSGTQILVRCATVSSKIGLIGLPFVGLNLFVMSWAVAKVYFAYACEDHVWGIATGCVKMHPA